MIHDNEIAKQLAKSLLQIKAIILQPENPFTWAAGWKSPIYCDNRKTLSFPEIRTYIRQSLASAVNNQFKGSNIIGGVATAGIPHGVLLAEELGLPFIYVRSQAKSHGKQNKIEGYYDRGSSVILIEDLISSGKSSLEAVNTLRNANLNVKGVISIFTYGFSQAKENFENDNCKFISLCNYKYILEEALATNYISKKELPILEEWRKKPELWGKIKNTNI